MTKPLFQMALATVMKQNKGQNIDWLQYYINMIILYEARIKSLVRKTFHLQISVSKYESSIYMDLDIYLKELQYAD
jgi:hypothetical protein